MKVQLFNNSIAQQKEAQKPETAGIIANAPKKVSPLFEAKKQEAITPDAIEYSQKPETAGVVACGLDGQAKTSTAGNSLSLAA